jgi:1,2-dihydroxy-3-keto-5-methylthiopentene dioxygenase
MAIVIIRGNTKEIIGKEAVADCLKNHGLIYQWWDTDRINGRLKDSYQLNADEQKMLVNAYSSEISQLKAREGYVTEDVVVLSPETPNLDELLAKFSREHHHTDDEVRFVVDGKGIFTIRQGGLIIDLVVEAGDLIVVPALTRHWFNLTEEKRIKCIRIFKDSAGWTAIYEEPTGKN